MALGVVTVFALLLGFSSLGLSQAQRSRPGQIFPPTPTFTQPPPTDTPTIVVLPPTDTPTPSATGVAPTDTPPPGSQPTSSRPGRPSGPPATPSLGIKVNACSRVVGPDGLSLGDAPGIRANHVQIVGRDDVVFVTAGPERADGLWWWRVTTNTGVVGWGNNDHMLPFSGECFGLIAASATAAQAATVLPAIGSGAAAAVTPGGQAQLPSTGIPSGGLVAAGALVGVLLVAGLVRRRSQKAL
jgi:LPXTG-motif cell wall-anchored protein